MCTQLNLVREIDFLSARGLHQARPLSLALSHREVFLHFHFGAGPVYVYTALLILIVPV